MFDRAVKTMPSSRAEAMISWVDSIDDRGKLYGHTFHVLMVPKVFQAISDGSTSIAGSGP